MALEVDLLTCSVRVSRESIHTPRYLMIFDGARDLILPSTFVGIVIDGPGPSCLPLLDFVKWISSHFTWSVLSPLSLSHLCADSNAAFTIEEASSLEWAIAVMDPSSTYSVWGNRAAWLVRVLLRMGVSSAVLVMVPECMASLSGVVKYVARISEAHDPWGTPVLIDSKGSCFSSSLIMAFLFWRNE